MPPVATPPDVPLPTVAIAHDYLTQYGGAERVVLAMLRAFPGAPVHTALYDPSATYPEFKAADVRTMPLNRIRWLRQRHRYALPVLAYAFSRLHITADVVVCSSSGWAHGISTRGRKVVYCHTPARWLYQAERYLARTGALARCAANCFRPSLLRWDRAAAASADRYLTQSTEVRRRIRDTYAIDAECLPPPPAFGQTSSQAPIPGLDPGFLLCVSRLLPYKNVGAIIEAARMLPTERVIIVGTGPEKARLVRVAPANVELVGVMSDAHLAWLYANCDAVVAASYEDYGLTPLEAAAFGKPTVALRWGGFLDTIVEAETGVLFDAPTPGAICDAIRQVRSRQVNPAVIRQHAERFSLDAFVTRLRQIVLEVAR